MNTNRNTTFYWKYQRQDWGKEKRYMPVFGKDTCDGFEVHKGGDIFTRKADVKQFCRRANRELEKECAEVTP